MSAVEIFSHAKGWTTHLFSCRWHENFAPEIATRWTRPPSLGIESCSWQSYLFYFDLIIGLSHTLQECPKIVKNLIQIISNSCSLFFNQENICLSTAYKRRKNCSLSQRRMNMLRKYTWSCPEEVNMILSHVVFTRIFLLCMAVIGKWIPNKADAMQKSIPSWVTGKRVVW